MTLREVEEATNKEVSNGYLSQLESGRISKPSPHILYTLSSVLADIMSATGWKKALYDGVFLPLASPINASALYGLANVAVLFIFAYVLYRRKIFFKL